MNNIKYIVRPEDKVVVGILEVDLEDCLEPLFGQMNPHLRSIAYKALESTEVRWVLDHYTIRGIARCADDDEFDEVYGKKLVEAKIYKKLHEKIQKALCRASDDMLNTVRKFTEEAVRHGKKVDGIQKDMKEYFNMEG